MLPLIIAELQNYSIIILNIFSLCLCVCVRLSLNLTDFQDGQCLISMAYLDV